MKDLILSKAFKKTNSKDSLQTSSSIHNYHYKKYNKITYTIRSQFLQLIINGNCSIKKAAQILNINYSSAKSIISEFRKQSVKTFKGDQPQLTNICLIKEIQKEDESKITLNISIGSSVVSQKKLHSLTMQQLIAPVQRVISPIFCCT